MTLINLAVVLFVFVQNLCDSKFPKLDTRIFGGEEVNINDHLYLLSLERRSGFCGASILNERTALTTARCVKKHVNNASNLSVRAGSNHTNTGGEVVKVESILIHPKYNIPKYSYDVAIIRLVTSLTMGVNINLPSIDEDVPIGAEAELIGWDRLIGDGESLHLQKVKVNRVDDSECNATYEGDITSSMFCFLGNKEDACQGDSGYPLVYNNKVLGIASWGRGCASPNYPKIYTKLFDLFIHAFITENIN